MSAPPGPSGPAAARGGTRRLRVDAERNRAALLDAAREVFAEQGLEAPLEEIALRAGVGIATLYRRFPTRTQLVAAALIDKITQYAEAAEQALAIPDPWAGFVSYVERICDMLAELIGRAKAAGRLREEFAGEDLLLLLVAHAAVVHVTREDAPSAGRRFVALMLDAFGPRDGPSALPVPPSRTQMRRAMVRLAGERGCGERGCGQHG